MEMVLLEMGKGLTISMRVCIHHYNLLDVLSHCHWAATP